MPIKIIVLAAGKGTRMKSNKPKVLHKLGGRSLVQHVLDNTKTLNPSAVYTVVGYGAEQVIEQLADQVTFVQQTEQKGTGHAVQQVLTHLQDEDHVIIGYGDVPLTSPSTFEKLAALCNETQIGLLTVNFENPQGYGRIIRGKTNKVLGIVEEKDATEEQRKIKETNSGMLSATGKNLKLLLSQIKNNNSQGEYYLTDIFALAVSQNIAIKTTQPDFQWEVSGVNSRQQLALLERIYQSSMAEKLMEEGATLADPARVDVRGKLHTSTDVEIDVNCVFIGTVILGKNVVIGPNCVISDSTIGDGTVIQANSVIDNATIGEKNIVGPFARLRPGAITKSDTHIGNFVEIKNSVIDNGSKINHLSYIGDCDVGSQTNIGAGTITCNYDGAYKHRTIIGDNVFVGSNTALVAPVEIGSRATVAAGSVVVKNAKKDQLVISRSRQTQIDNWIRPRKK